jgi:hypothetical protein
MIKPVAGLAMAFRCAVFILGGSNPFVVLLTSSCAEAAGVVVPIPIFCAMLVIAKAKKTNIVNAFFITDFF